MKTKYFSSKFFKRYVSDEPEFPNIVDGNTPDRVAPGQRDELKDTGIRLCQEIADISGLSDGFKRGVNAADNSIKSKSFGDNYLLNVAAVGPFGVDRAHRIVVCNFLNQIKSLLIEFKENPSKYDWQQVCQTLEIYNNFGNCEKGRAETIEQLVIALKGVKLAQEGMLALVQQIKERVIYSKILGLNPDVHDSQRIKELVAHEYGLTPVNSDYLFLKPNGLQGLHEYVHSKLFFEDFMNALAEEMTLHPVVRGGEDGREQLFNLSTTTVNNAIFKENGIKENLIYRNGDATEWNANINSIRRLHYIQQVLFLGIFTDKTKEQFLELITPAVMRLVAMLGQNIQSADEREGFVENAITCEYEKPNSAYRIPEFHSYRELLTKLNSDKVHHFKEQNVQDIFKQVVAEQEMKLHAILSLDSYQVTRLAHMIAARERSSDNLHYRNLDSILKYSDDANKEKPIGITNTKLTEIAREVQRIQNEDGFTRTLKECLYDVYDFFRWILGMSIISGETKRDCETFLYVKDGHAEARSFTELLGLRREESEPVLVL